MGLAQGKVASLFVEFRATVNQFAGDMAQISREVRQFDRIVSPISRRVGELGFALSAGLTAPLIGAGALALKTGVDFESAFAGVKKTVEASDEQIAVLRNQLIDLSERLPVTATEFAHIAQAAGQLGIEAPNIAKFSETMAELESATNLSAVAGGKALARFTNITKLPDDKIHNLASSLALLGDRFAADEAEIINFAQRMASVGKIVGLSSAEILGFATAFRDVGVRAESGGTAITRVMAEIATAVAGGTSKLAQFASVAGKPVDDFAKLFKDKPAEAIAVFVEGLKRIETEGGNVFSTLQAMGLQNVRIRDTLLSLAEGGDIARRAIVTATEEFEKNAHLSREVAERNKTTGAQFQILKNHIDAVSIALFDTLAPAINSSVIPAMKRLIDDGLKPAVEWFAKLPTSAQQAVGGMVIFAAAIGPVILFINQLIYFIGGVGIVVGKLVEKLGTSGLAGAASKLTAPLTLIGTVLAAWELENIIIDVLGLGKQFDDAKSSAVELGRAVLNLVGAFGKFAISQVVEEIKNFKSVIETALGPAKQLAILFILPQIVRGNVEIKALTGYINELSKMMDDMATAAKRTEGETDRLLDNLVAWGQEMPALAQAMARVAAAGAITTGGGRGSIGPSPEELKAQEDAAEELRKEHERLIERFTAELAPANALNKELDFLLRNFSESQVVALYGQRIVEAAESQWDHNLAVSGSVGVLYEQAKALEKVREQLEEIRREPIELIPFPITGELPGPQTNEIELKALTDFTNAREQIEKLGKAINNLDFLGVNAQIALFNGDLDQAAKFAEVFGFKLDPAIADLIKLREAAEQSAAGTKAWEDAANAGLETFDSMTSQIATTGEAIRRMQAAQIGHDVILEIMGGTIDQVAENIRKLGIDINSLDPKLQVFIRFRELMNEAKDEASELEKEMSRVTAKIINDLANGIADALLGSKSIAEIGAKIGKDFASSFVRATISGMIAPLVEKFTEMGRELGKILANFAKAHPVIAAVIGAALAAVTVIKALGNTHLFANQFVKETQNPFGKSLAEITDAADKLYAAGRQTYQGAQDAEKEVQKLWQGFLEDAQKFGEQGRKQATVAAQAIATLEPTIRQVIFGIQKQIESLKPPSLRVTESVQQLEIYRAAIARNTEEYVAEVQARMNAIDDEIQWIQRQITTEDDLGNSTADLNRQMQDLIRQWNELYDSIHPAVPELYRFAEAVRAVSEKLVPDKTLEFLDEVLNATAGTANLEEALSILEQIGTPVGIVIDRLGQDAAELADALKLSGLPIPDLIAKYAALHVASKNAGVAINGTIADIKNFADAARAASQALVPDKTDEFISNVVNATAGSANLEAALSFLESIKTPVAIIVDRLGNDIENFANVLKASGLPIPPLIEKYLQLKKASEESAKDMPRIANSLSKLVGDAVEKLRTIAGGGDLAQGILDALGRLLTGLPQPVVTAENTVRDAIDKLRGVTENILAAIQKFEPPAPTNLALTQSEFNVAGTEFAVPNPAVTQIVINIADNEVINNNNYFTDEISREVVRDRVIPEITEALDNNSDSTREKWIRRLRGAGVTAIK